MFLYEWLSAVLVPLLVNRILAADDDFNTLNRDGSYEFGYNNPDSFHFSQANRNNVVRGRFGGRNPGTGAIDTTVYTAGPRGYRPRGKNIARNFDQHQSGPRPIGSKDDPYFDPNEDPSYNFGFRTRTYSRQEAANRVGDVNGRYTYLDDENTRHDIEYIAGKNTGFHVTNAYPDNPRTYGNGYFRGRGKPPRGRTSIQRGLDGSYKFVSAGPDQRRTETSDSLGNVRGSYTYLDDKGVQHAVHYIAGPGIGYRVLKNVKGPHLPTIYPFGQPDIIPPDFYASADKNIDGDLFDTAASGHVKPIDNSIGKPDFGSQRPSVSTSTAKPESGGNLFGSGADKLFGSGSSFGGSKPLNDYDEDVGIDELFQNDPVPRRPSAAPRPNDLLPPGGNDAGFRPSKDDGSGDDGSYQPEKYGNSFDGPGGSSQIKPAGAFGDISSESDSKPFGSGSQPSSKPTGAQSASRPFAPPRLGSESDLDRGDATSGLNYGNFDFDFKPDGSGRPTIQLGIGGTGSSNLGGTTFLGSNVATIVKNVGDTLFTVPPGVSVRAHVQSIDLLPLNSRSPSPSEQYQRETAHVREQLNAATSNVDEHIRTNSTRITSSSSSSTTTSSTTSPTTTIATTTPVAETTTVITTSSTHPENSTDV